MKRIQKAAVASSDALDFAPEVLSIQERVPSPLRRLVLYILLGFIATALVWSAIGRLDIIAVASGKIVPRSYLQIVQPAEAGIIRELLVKDGDEVVAGQVLARMDAKAAEADIRILQNDLQLRNLQLRRIAAELSGMPLTRRSDDPPDLYAEVQAQYAARRRAHLDALAAEQSVLAKAQSDLKAAGENYTKLMRTVPIYRDQADGWEKLANEGYAGRLLALDRKRLYIESHQDLQAQAHNLESVKATIAQSHKRIAQIISNYRQQLHDERIDAEGFHRRLQREWEKQSHRRSLLELRAPQGGLVKDLATHTIGSVVAPGAIVMTLVPHDVPMQAEVWVTNADAGFVEPGQAVQLKLAAYPFQQYGMVEGEVRHISPDSTEAPAARHEGDKAYAEDAPPSSYRTVISLKTPYLQADSARYRISPGMQVTGEIKLGTRTVLQYLLSPVRKIVHEAARER
jgi:type I secretion membrane fusion protein, HlyD family